MADLEELEPLFDYRRDQSRGVICLDDDEFNSGSSSPKRRKVSKPAANNKVDKYGRTVHILDDDKDEEKENDDWLPSPPTRVACDAKILAENSTIRELRLKKQELAMFAQSAEEVLRAMEEESAEVEIGKSLESYLEDVAEKPSKPETGRAKIVVSVQDKDGPKQFRIYSDDKFERLFKLYAEKVKLEIQSLVFCFDGEKVDPEATPVALAMEDGDILEVHVKKSS